MKRERNLQEDEEEVDDVDSHREKPVKMEIDEAEESERSGDDLRDNTRILHHYQNERSEGDISECEGHISYVRVPEDHPEISIPSGRSELDSSVFNYNCVLSVNLPSEDSNLHKQDRDENSEMDEAEQREITYEFDQESIQEHGNEGEGCKDQNENASDEDDNKSNSSLQRVTDLDKEDRDENPEAGERETHESVRESIQEGYNEIMSKRTTMYGALNYLKDVKRTFDNEREKYEMFLTTMTDFKNQRCDTADFLERMREILKGHDLLILGLNFFLPKGHQIPHSCDEEEMFIKTALGAYERCFEVYRGIIEGRIIVEGPFQFERHFRPSHLWCIKRAYTDSVGYAFNVRGAIRQDPTNTLTIIMRRLRQKYEECRRYHSMKRKL